MPLTLNGNGTIQNLVAGGLPDGSVDADTLSSGVGVSSIRQMITKQYGAKGSDTTDISSPSDTSFSSGYDWTPFNISITPNSSSNYIWVTGSLSFSHRGAHAGFIWITYNHSGISETPIQGKTGVYPVSYRVENDFSGTNIAAPITVNLLFAPATTNAIAIKVRSGSTNGSSYPMYLNQTAGASTDAEDGMTPTSSLTVFEIDNAISPSLTNTNINS